MELAIIEQFATFIKAIDQAYKLYKSLKAAPSELKATKSFIHGLTIVLQSIRSDLIEDPNSIVNSNNSLRAKKRAEISKLSDECIKSLHKVEKVLKKYNNLSRDLWLRWRWSREGKQTVAQMDACLICSTNNLSLYMQNLGLGALGRMELLIQKMMGICVQQTAGPAITNTQRRPNLLLRQNFRRVILVSLFVSRLVAKWKSTKAAIRARKVNMHKRRNSGFVRSGPKPNAKKSTLMKDYSKKLLEEQSENNGSKLNEQFECYVLSDGHVLFTTNFHETRQVKRGQLQLAEMVTILNEAALGSGEAVDPGNQAVKNLIAWRNKKSWHGENRKWGFAAGRIQSKKASRHGATSVEKMMVIIKRKMIAD
jgi:hypothetical protein